MNADAPILQVEDLWDPVRREPAWRAFAEWFGR